MAIYKIIFSAFFLFMCISCEKDNVVNQDNKVDAVFLPIDSEGWTEFSPSSDTRILYISKDGNDSEAEIYSIDDNSNPFKPSESIKSFATYEAAFANTRDGYPDWILYKRGDIFHEAPKENIRSGRSSEEPFLIGSYGNSGASPVIKTGTGAAILISRESPSKPDTFKYIAIQGLNFYANTRNPNDNDFEGYGYAGHGILISTYNERNRVNNILVEGCCVSFYRDNIVVQAAGEAGSVSNIEIRRNTILNSHSETSHSQGIYAAGVDGLIIEENIFDHNGWLRQSSSNDRTEGGATFHNHNIYSDGVQHGTYRRNIIMRASSIGSKIQGGKGIEGMVVDNNLYIDGEIGIESCNNYHENFYRIKAPTVSNNIFYELGLSNPTLRNVGWGMWIQGWDGGKVFNNLLMGNQGQMFFNLGLRSRGIEIYNNIGLSTVMKGIYHDSEVELTACKIYGNYFEKLDEENFRILSSSEASIDGIEFSNNRYYGPNGVIFKIDTDSYTEEEWISYKESDAQFSQKQFPDRSRTIETYMESIGEESTLDSFIEMCRSQERYHWDSRFSAEVVNKWLRSGYGISY